MKEQLFITEFDNTDLPEEYHFSHNISVRMYDDLVDLLKDKKIQRKLNIKIDFDENDDRPDVDEKDILSWLVNNGKKDIAEQVISIHTVFALISDMCHFIFQALDSAKKYKLAVAYSLIRKPFLENLVIIEELLVNEKKFLAKFELTPETFDPGKLKDQDKQYLISEALKKIKSGFFTDELVFELRFDKNSPNGIYATANSATHLVTTRHPIFKTESQNLNFVFSKHKEWESQLDHFYNLLPYVLHYATEVVDRYAFEKKMINKLNYKKRKFYRFIIQLLVHDNDAKSIKGNSWSNKFSRHLKVKCKSCNKTNQLYKSDLYSLINNSYILCKHCLVDLYHENNSLDESINKMIEI